MKAILFLALATAGMFLSSCNTMIGVGRDMRMGGEGLENVANKASGGGGGGGDVVSDDYSGAPVY
jgi:predicted small secreted protein